MSVQIFGLFQLAVLFDVGAAGSERAAADVGRGVAPAPNQARSRANGRRRSSSTQEDEMLRMIVTVGVCLPRPRTRPTRSTPMGTSTTSDSKMTGACTRIYRQAWGQRSSQPAGKAAGSSAEEAPALKLALAAVACCCIAPMIPLRKHAADLLVSCCRQFPRTKRARPEAAV